MDAHKVVIPEMKPNGGLEIAKLLGGHLSFKLITDLLDLRRSGAWVRHKKLGSDATRSIVQIP